MNEKTFKRIFFGLLALGFLYVTLREYVQAGMSRDAMITAALFALMTFQVYRNR